MVASDTLLTFEGGRVLFFFSVTKSLGDHHTEGCVKLV